MKRIDAAREQLVTALDLYLGDKSPVSVHSLAGNARELIEVACRIENRVPFIEHIVEQTAKSRKEIYFIMNQHRNAFKHADANDQDLLENFNDKMNDALLAVVIFDYLTLAGKATVEMQVYQAWWLACNFSKMSPAVQGEYADVVEEFRPFYELDRKAQKAALLKIVEKTKRDYEIMTNKATET